MHLAQHAFRKLAGTAALAVLACMPAGTAAAGDRQPLVGITTPSTSLPTGSAATTTGQLMIVDPTTVPCVQTATFDDNTGGPTPGASYDGILLSGGVYFAERFAGQSVSYAGPFDMILGAPSTPLALQAGAAGQNLDVFEYASNVLTGLGHLGFSDMDAIGEGSIAMYFSVGQSRISFDVVGGNGGSAQLDFYRVDGTLIDTVVLTGLTDVRYGFATVHDTQDISGVLIQSTDVQGIGIDNVCHELGFVKTNARTWGSVKSLYR